MAVVRLSDPTPSFRKGHHDLEITLVSSRGDTKLRQRRFPVTGSCRGQPRLACRLCPSILHGLLQEPGADAEADDDQK